MMNPYFDTHFFSFLSTLLFRIIEIGRGILTGNTFSLYSDEIQLFTFIALSLSSVFSGTFLMLKKSTMQANSLSHTILLGIVLAYFLSGQSLEEIDSFYLLLGALPLGFFTIYLTSFLKNKTGLEGDASTGLVLTFLFALGVFSLTFLTKSAHLGLEAVMGNADALNFKDFQWAALSVFLNGIVFFIFRRTILITSFDPLFGRSQGFSLGWSDFILALLTSLTVIVSFRGVGVLIPLAFLSGLPMMGRLLSYNVKKILLLASTLGVCLSVISVALTRHIFSEYAVALSTGGVLSLLILTCFIALLNLRKVA